MRVGSAGRRVVLTAERAATFGRYVLRRQARPGRGGSMRQSLGFRLALLASTIGGLTADACPSDDERLVDAARAVLIGLLDTQSSITAAMYGSSTGVAHEPAYAGCHVVVFEF